MNVNNINISNYVMSIKKKLCQVIVKIELKTVQELL